MKTAQGLNGGLYRERFYCPIDSHTSSISTQAMFILFAVIFDWSAGIGTNTFELPTTTFIELCRGLSNKKKTMCKSTSHLAYTVSSTMQFYWSIPSIKRKSVLVKKKILKKKHLRQPGLCPFLSRRFSHSALCKTDMKKREQDQTEYSKVRVSFKWPQESGQDQGWPYETHHFYTPLSTPFPQPWCRNDELCRRPGCKSNKKLNLSSFLSCFHPWPYSF